MSDLRWRREGEAEEAQRRSQLSLALGQSRGVTGRLLTLGEIALELADTPIGRLVVATAAVTGAWVLL